MVVCLHGHLLDKASEIIADKSLNPILLLFISMQYFYWAERDFSFFKNLKTFI